MTDEDAMKAVVSEVISMYHTTRLDSDPVPHVLSKPSVQRAFAAFAEREAAIASLPPVGARVEYFNPNLDWQPIAVVTAHVEGWVELQWDDGGTGIVRPSRVRAAQKGSDQ